MKIAITGASGLVGRDLGIVLTKSGHELIVLARRKSAEPHRFPFPCEILEWDTAKSSELPKELWSRNIDGLIHLAGESIGGKRWTKSWKDRLWNSRVNGASVIAQSIANLPPAQRPNVVVTASAVGFYGEAKDRILEESSEVGAGFLAELCQAWEGAFTENLPQETRFVAIRTGLVMSEKGGLLDRLAPVFRFGVGGVLGSGRQWMSWIHLDDLVQMYKTSIESAEWNGAFNGVAPQPLRNIEFTKCLAKILKRPAVLPVPYFALRIALGEFAKHIVESQRVIPMKAEAINFKFKFPSLEGALQDIFSDSRRNRN